MARRRDLDWGSLSALYKRRLPAYERLRTEVLFILEEELKDARIPHHALQSRLKEWQSFREKAERKQLADPWREVKDICGIRVVCLFRADVPRILTVVKSAFDVVEEDDKTSNLGADIFGYMATHAVVSLPSKFTGPRYKNLHGLRAEIQIRTICMDAWASVSHHLDYKSPTTVPTPLKRDFYALSGLFYLAETHFELFLKEAENVRKAATEAVEETPAVLEKEISVYTIPQYFAYYADKTKRSLDANSIPDPRQLSDFVEELLESGYFNFAGLDDDVNRATFALLSIEQEEISDHASEAFGAIEAIKISLGMIKPKEFGHYVRFWSPERVRSLIGDRLS